MPPRASKKRKPRRTTKRTTKKPTSVGQFVQRNPQYRIAGEFSTPTTSRKQSSTGHRVSHRRPTRSTYAPKKPTNKRKVQRGERTPSRKASVKRVAKTPPRRSSVKREDISSKGARSSREPEPAVQKPRIKLPIVMEVPYEPISKSRLAPWIKASSVELGMILLGIDKTWWIAAKKSNDAIYWKRMPALSANQELRPIGFVRVGASVRANKPSTLLLQARIVNHR